MHIICSLATFSYFWHVYLLFFFVHCRLLLPFLFLNKYWDYHDASSIHSVTIFSIRFVYTETCSSPQCLATHSPDWFVDKSKQMANLVCKFMPTSQNIEVSTCLFKPKIRKKLYLLSSYTFLSRITQSPHNTCNICDSQRLN